VEGWKRYRVGSFLLDTSDRTIRSNGTIHALAPKEFDFLLLLVEHPGEVVSKEKIHATLWCDAIVSDGNLTQYAYRLRGLLGNEAIQTIPKRGYRLTVEVAADAVAEMAGSSAAGEAAPLGAKAAKISVPRRWIWVFSLGPPAALALIAAWSMRSFHPSPEAYDLFLRGQARLEASLSSRPGVRTADERAAAISLFRRAVEMEPRYADAHAALAETLCYANDKGFDSDQQLVEAAATANHALRYDAENLRARTALICIAKARGKQDEALRIAVQIEQMRNNSPEASFAAGEAFLRAGLAQRSVGQLRRAVEKAPQKLQFRLELAYALMLAGRSGECIETLSPALKKEEGGYWHAMNCLKELSRYDEAIAYGVKLLDTDPDAATAYRGLALSYRAAGREREARTILIKAIKHFEGVQETSPSVRNASFLALMNAHLGKKEDVVRWVNAALAGDPDNSYILYQAGLAFGILGDDLEAVEMLERAFARGFALKYYFDWQIKPAMGVATLTSTARYKTLEQKLEKRIAELELSLRSK